MEDIRIRKYARFLIRKAVYLQKGEKVLIELHGDENAIPLVRALVEEAYAVGGEPYVQQFDEELMAAVMKGSSDAHMQAITSYQMDRMKHMDAYIDVRASKNIHEWDNLSHESLDCYKRTYWGPLHLSQRCNHTKWSVIRYPNSSMAQLAGMSTGEFEDFYFKACLVDYDKMAKAMEPLVRLMERTDQVHITGPDTDLRFSIKGIGVSPWHGQCNIPDGEVSTAPVKNSVNGRIHYNIPSPYNGAVYSDVVLTFENGRIVKADSNLPERMDEIFDTDEGARYVGEFAIGCNPYITRPVLDILFDEKMVGSFHFTPGNAYERNENGNHSAQHWDLICCQTPEYGGGEIWFDGVLIRKDGRFVLPELEGLNPENLK